MTWSKPQLVRLVHGTPEQSVLTACKSGVTGTTPYGQFSACNGGVPTGSCGPAVPNGHISAIQCLACSTTITS